MFLKILCLKAIGNMIPVSAKSDSIKKKHPGNDAPGADRY